MMLGLILALSCLPFLVEALPFEKPDWRWIGLDGKVLLFTLALTTLSTVGFGALRACLTTRTSLPKVKTTRSSERLRGLLVGSEMALAMILVVGAGLMLKSFWSVVEQDLGFDTERIATLRVNPSPATYGEPEQRRNFYRRALEQIRALPGVLDAGVARRLPLQGARFTALRVEGQPSEGERGYSVQWTPADPGYFRTLGLGLVEGRGFDGSERDNTEPVALVNETFAQRFWRGESAIGRRVRFVDSEDEWITILGVVENVKQNGARGFAYPMILSALRATANPQYADRGENLERSDGGFPFDTASDLGSGSDHNDLGSV